MVTTAGVIMSTAYFLPYGGYRYPSTPPPSELTDTGFTGHKHNDSVGLIYMQARFYVPSIGRFASADTIVPGPTNPQAYNRYSYVLGNPLRLVDPSGHGICDPEGNCQNNPPPPSCNPVNPCDTTVYPPGKYGQVQEAYDVYHELEELLGRPPTNEEVLALLGFYEFGWLYKEERSPMSGEDFLKALEAMARQFYFWCGADGVCDGHQLWLFLGAHQGWYNKDAKFLHANLPGILDFMGQYARMILDQPLLSDSPTQEELMSNWRSGLPKYPGEDVYMPVPFTYGNYSMLYDNGWTNTGLAEVPDGTTAKYGLLVNISEIRGGNGYMVMTIGQFGCLTGEQSCD
ncbi:MAG: RHS repeat-associated core domain-containing protein [Chloroflexi bacterium]|nr:RHS repeat-associated core domain-containing protein [Chloroflexota bacterium]